MTQPARITLAHSPDADDLVMWWPLTGAKAPDGGPILGVPAEPSLDTLGFAFETIAADIHELNRRASESGDLDVTAISAYTYPFVRDRYRITRCGASFGDGYGPKVVVRADSPIMCDGCLKRQRPRIAVPGDRTTAFLTLSIVLGQPFDYVVMPFRDIAPAVASGRVGAGLLIHEAQLTFADLGLRQVIDLGAWWKARMGLPLPLGLNVLRRDLDARHGPGALERVAALLHGSVAFARSHPDECRALLRAGIGERPEWADDALVNRYLDMYVNESTADMGTTGRQSLERLYAEGANLGLCPEAGPIDPA
ncbi:MAG: ABC transporter substrate-binding protein [Phycisphaerales bacterium]|nr:ABC transporter substrate-binding protein [Phycisphaerales bacterium]